jgi:hypothetical protein
VKQPKPPNINLITKEKENFMTPEQKKMQDEAILAIFEDVTNEEYVEVFGEKCLFDSKFCDKWNLVMALTMIATLVFNLIEGM